MSFLPSDSQARKDIPMARGCLDYFPDALAAVAEVSRVGNEKHNPGEELHWAKGKSEDHADALLRHLVDRGTWDTLVIRGVTYRLRHSAEVAWRALANLQREIEADHEPAHGRPGELIIVEEPGMAAWQVPDDLKMALYGKDT